MLFTWSAVIDTPQGPAELRGREPVSWGGRLRVRADLPRGVIRSVTARTVLAVPEGGRIFMNGYQTWTVCPEYDSDSKIPGLSALPRSVIDKYGFDRYGDYHFVRYPNTRGVTHGFTWCYVRRGGEYKLVASLDEKPGYTMFMLDAKTACLTVTRDCGGLACGGEYPLFDLYFARGGEDQVFDGWFAAMDVTPLPAPRIKGYTSWYNRYTGITEDTIRSDLRGCEGLLDPGDLFQVDDGWEPAVGDWLEPDSGKFPSGMRALADEIHAAGFKAGLWLAPFVALDDSELARQHPDWLLKVNGRPWSLGSNWGGFSSLDIDVPEVTDYLRRVFDRVINEWGFDLLKLDFLYGAAPFGNERETRAGRMARAVDFLREVCGGTPILGCGVPVASAFGKVEYCRIGPDVSLSWDEEPYMRLCHRERVSTRQAILNTLYRRQLNGRAYLSDPDVFFLREENLTLRDDQKLLLSRVNALFGGVLLTSDDPSAYSEAQRALYRETVRLRDARNVRFDADNRRLEFQLQGEDYILPLPPELFE